MVGNFRRAHPDARVLLEVFAGSGNLSKAWRQLGANFAAFEVDSRHGNAFDLTSGKLQSTVRGWIASGLVDAVWVATPCSSFSRIR